LQIFVQVKLKRINQHTFQLRFNLNLLKTQINAKFNKTFETVKH